MRTFYQPALSLRGETAAYAILGLAGVASLLLAATAMFDFVNGKKSIVANLESPPGLRTSVVCCAATATNNRAGGESPAVRTEAATRAAAPGVVPVSFGNPRVRARS